MENNFAFIDAQNVHLATRRDNWTLDWRKFFVYLKDKYKVRKAYIFLGFISSNTYFYEYLKRCGYSIIFKEVVKYNKIIKGNVDAELVLQAAAKDFNEYEKAIIVSNDGDFTCLVKYLIEKQKFEAVLAPSFLGCSKLLRKAATNKIWYLSDAKEKLSKK